MNAKNIAVRREDGGVDWLGPMASLNNLAGPLHMWVVNGVTVLDHWDSAFG